MYMDVILCSSAYKHGIRKEDILWAFHHPEYDSPVEDAENKYIRLGFDLSGNLLEIMYNDYKLCRI